MSGQRFDTAHERWDAWWGHAKDRARWSDPDAAVTDLIPSLQSRGATRVVDVGAGIGRHALAFARAGFEVVAIDASSTGLEHLCGTAASEGLRIETHVAPFTALPIADASADHVLAWNVLYHGDGEIVRSALAECRRVLRHGGSFQLTMLSKRHRAFGVGREVRPDTYVDASSTDDKDHPHFYVDAPGLTALLAATGFDVAALIDVDQASRGGQPAGAFHWLALAQATTT